MLAERKSDKGVPCMGPIRPPGWVVFKTFFTGTIDKLLYFQFLEELDQQADPLLFGQLAEVAP